MANSARIEILNQLYTQSAGGGETWLREQDRRRAKLGFDEALKVYEKARRRLLRHELARYYRVAIFGSARLTPEDEDFKFVTELSKSLVEARGVDIVTGGGPGIMAAAHLGTHLALQNPEVSKRRCKSKNLGVTLSTLPTEETKNGYFHLESKHSEFSTRLQDFLDKTMASYNSRGGIGTLLEQLMLIQSRQVNHIEASYPIIAHPSWKRIVDTWNHELYHERKIKGQTTTISESDLNLITFSNKIPEIVDIISAGYDVWHNKIRRHVRITH